jgi:hypothetical protein
MEIVNIDAELFERMLLKFERFVDRVEVLCRLHTDKGVERWMDNQDVCLLLNISPRTLRTLRDDGLLGFSRISRKIYYKPEDVEKMIPLVNDMRKAAIRKGKRI